MDKWKIACAIAALSPYFLGVVFSWFPIRRIYFDALLERGLYFLLLFALWQIVLRLAFRVVAPLQNKTSQDHPPRTRPSKLIVAGLILSTVLFLFALQFFKLRLPETHFLIGLFALGALALERSLRIRGSFRAGLACRFLSVASIGYLSFLIVDPILKWEPFIPCASLAVVFVARDMVYSLAQRSTSTLSSRGYLALSRGAIAGFLLGPTLLSALSYFGKLSPNYFFVFGICPLLLPLAEALRKGEKTREVPGFVVRRADVIFLAYVAIVYVVGLIGRIV